MKDDEGKEENVAESLAIAEVPICLSLKLWPPVDGYMITARRCAQSWGGGIGSSSTSREIPMTSYAQHSTFQESEPASPDVSATLGVESVQAQGEDEVKSGSDEKETEEPVKAGEDGPTNLGEAREAAKVCQLLTWFLLLYAYSYDRRERHQNSRLRELDCTNRP